GAVKHATECDPIDRAGMDAETNDPSRGLIHNHQDPVGAQGYRLTAEPIHTPEAFFHVAEESQPGRPARALSRPVVMGENPSNHVLVDCKVEGQGVSVQRFADHPSGDCVASFRRSHGRVLHSGPSGRACDGDWMRTTCDIFACTWLGEGPAGLRASAQWQTGAGEWAAATASANRQGSGPTRTDSALVAGSDSGSGVDA